MLKRIATIILTVAWLVFLFLQRVNIYESLTAIYVLPVLIAALIISIFNENVEPEEDFHSKEQHKFYKGAGPGRKSRKTEEDWRKWYEDIDEAGGRQYGKK